MLTASEKRFIKSWEDQRKGGRYKYYLLYIIAGTFVAILILSFLAAMVGGFPSMLKLIIIISFSIVAIATLVSWQLNEKKFKSIIQREIREGIKKDEAEGNGK
ncbi:hypothetical protein A3860_38535 [Niastella vici]|uniref:Uncharacterized protein n=1 Tax=Niastella vici TaxID=1703345 RepID=A0A1V9FL89_9BACT|nr:hypothetical protein [Niastella vici]OQP59139.1 hypothetical protein A3860_38535 [Niastella vici]